MKQIKIRAASSTLTKSNPYLIDDNALVAPQSFWGGFPNRLIGFSIKPIDGQCDIGFDQFWATPYVCIGKYAVFEDRNGKTTTLKYYIESFSIER